MSKYVLATADNTIHNLNVAAKVFSAYSTALVSRDVVGDDAVADGNGIPRCDMQPPKKIRSLYCRSAHNRRSSR